MATEFYAELKEVILGPKFMNRSDVMPYLQEQIDLMCVQIWVKIITVIKI